MKEQVKNALRCKKCSRVMVVVAVALVLALTVRFAMNKTPNGSAPEPGYYDFSSFSINGVTIGADAAAINASRLSPANGYGTKYHAEKASYSGTSGYVTTIRVNVYGGGAYIPSLICGGELRDIPYNLTNIEQVISLLGSYYSDGWYDREQGLRFIKYDDRSGNHGRVTEITFVYADGELGGIKHRLTWVIAAIVPNRIPYDFSYDFTSLSALKTSYVSDNSAVAKIVNLLPVPDTRLAQRFMSIGDDYGTGLAPNTLTLYYEPSEPGAVVLPEEFSMNNYCEKNFILLFALIDNLQEIHFTFRPTATADGELDKSAYGVRLYCIRSTDDVMFDWSKLWDGGMLSVEDVFRAIDEGDQSELDNLETIPVSLFKTRMNGLKSESEPAAATSLAGEISASAEAI
jgi:hypothetical protein